MTTQHNDVRTRLNDLQIDTPHGSVYASELPGDNPPIVLMHGFPDDHRIYDRLVPRLSPRRAVAFDFVGYGRSDRPERTEFSSQAHGDQITAVLDALQADRLYWSAKTLLVQTSSPTPSRTRSG
jgi:2-hydroxy-6-oxonona-2,4-dienedioate hydrolase